MKHYPEYKESSVEFIGEIPKAWHLTKLKYVAQIDNSGLWGEEQGLLDIDASVSTTAHLTRNGDWLIEQMPIRSFSKADYEYYSGKNGDIIVVKSSGSATNIITGKAGFIDYLSKGIVFSNFLMRVKPNREKYEPKLLYYFLTSSITIERIKRMVSTTTYPNLKVEEYISNLIPIPPSKDEQVKIANFLNRKTGQIDELIRIKERRIELLQEQRTALINQAVTKGLAPNVEMKPSGVEWIGEIPKRWTITRLKYLGESIIGLSYKPEDVTDDKNGTLVLRASNIQNGKPSFLDNVYVSAEVDEKLYLKEDDILICSRSGSRELIGKNITITKELEGVTFGVFMTIFRTKFFRFISYFLNSQVFKNQSGLFLTSTINQLTINTLNNFLISFPTDEREQAQIADFLDHKTEQIDELVAAEQRKIELLKEYRQSLISEAVTGKIDVRSEV